MIPEEADLLKYSRIAQIKTNPELIEIALRSTGPIQLRPNSDNVAFVTAERERLREKVNNPVTPLQRFVLNHEVFVDNLNRLVNLMDKVLKLMDQTWRDSNTVEEAK